MQPVFVASIPWTFNEPRPTTDLPTESADELTRPGHGLEDCRRGKRPMADAAQTLPTSPSARPPRDLTRSSENRSGVGP